MSVALDLVIGGPPNDVAEACQELNEDRHRIGLRVRRDGIDHLTGKPVIGGAIHNRPLSLRDGSSRGRWLNDGHMAGAGAQNAIDNVVGDFARSLTHFNSLQIMTSAFTSSSVHAGAISGLKFRN